jgi:hypothetical protein
MECENIGNCVYCEVETRTCCGGDYQCDFCHSEICFDCYYENDKTCLICERKLIKNGDLFRHLVKKYGLSRQEVVEEYKNKVVEEENKKKEEEKNEIQVVALGEDLYREANYGFIIKRENDNKLFCEKIEDSETKIWRDLTEREIKHIMSKGIIVPSFEKELMIMKEEYGIDYYKEYQNTQLSNKEIISILQKNREIEMKKILGKDIASYLNKFYMQI